MQHLRVLLPAAALAALVGAGAAPASAAEFVTNGKFTEVTGNGVHPSFFLADGQGDLTDWTTSSNEDSNNILFASPSDVATRHDNVKFGFWSTAGVTASPDGGNFVAFDGDPTPGARQTMSQTISGLTAGETYHLSFEWAATQYEYVNGPAGDWTGATSNQIDVSLGGVAQHTTLIPDVPSQGFTGWKAASFDFTASSASEMLVFLSEGGPTGLPPVALLADVSLTGDVPGAVPEPGTWAMMGIGFAGLGLVAYRRRRKALAIG